MPAKKAPTKAKKAAAKKGSKKVAAGFPIPPLPLVCIRAAFDQYMACLKKGVDPALCSKRYMKNLQNCFIKK
jgi:hypothetical protein